MKLVSNMLFYAYLQWRFKLTAVYFFFGMGWNDQPDNGLGLDVEDV